MNIQKKIGQKIKCLSEILLLSFICATIFGQDSDISNSISIDTTLAGEYFEEAKCIEEETLYGGAIDYYKKAATIYKRHQVWDRYIRSLHGIGKNYLSLSEADSAMIYSEKAFSVAEQYFDQKHRERANAYFYLGLCQEHKGSYDDALEYHKQALEIRLGALGPSHPDVADSYNNMGACYLHKASFDDALKYHKQALEIRLGALGSSHLDVAGSYNNIGSCYLYKGSFDDALEYLKKALTIRSEVLGTSHLDVASSYNNIGFCYYLKGSNDKALEYHEKALHIQLELLGECHLHVARSYGNIGNCYSVRSSYNTALEYYKKSLEIHIDLLGEFHPDVARSYNNIGACYSDMGFYDMTLKYYEKALLIKVDLLGESHPSVAISYNNIGGCYQYKGFIDMALEYYRKALRIQLDVLGESHPGVVRYYNNIGNCYHIKGSYDLALEYYKKSLQIQLDQLGESNAEIAVYYNNIGLFYWEKGSLDQALEYHRKALHIRLDLLGESHPEVALSYNNIGICYRDKACYDKALEYHEKALRIRIDVLGQSHPQVALSYNNIGACYSDKDSNDLALKYLKKALNIQNGVFGQSHPDIALSYNNIGNAYNKKGDLDEALTQYQQGITVLCDGFTNTDIATNPILKGITSKIVLLDVLKGKAETLSQKYDTKGKIDDLKLSFSTYKLATSLIDSVRFEMMKIQDKQDFIDNSISIYEQTINTAYSLHEQTQNVKYLHSAFEITEKSKAFLLLQALKNSEARQFANIPDTLLAAERENNQSIAGYEKRLTEEQWKQKNERDSSKITVWEDKVFNLKRQRDSLINYFEIKYPGYYKLKYDLKVCSVEHVQKKLINNSDKAFIEYFAGDSNIYIFCITQSNINLHRIKKDSLFDQTLDQYLQNIRQASLKNQKRTFENYTEVAYRLYQLLLEKPLQTLDTTINQLIIIPDGILGHVSFNALVTQSGKKSKKTVVYNPKKPHYLIKDYTVSYAYSATLLSEQFKPKTRKKAKYQLAGFAPVFDKVLLTESKSHFHAETDSVIRYTIKGCKINLSDLPNTKKEIKGIAKIVKSKCFLDHDASKDNFIKVAGYSNILHLATHGCAKDKDPMYSRLYFSDDELETYELFNMQLNADLTVLSACDTGIGEVQRGEGIMSLSRGFAYAGCPAMISSLWSADDKATSEIMVHFYKMLKKGQSKDKALRNAQLAYINDPDKYSKEIHPYYWAAFIQMGNTNAIDLEQGWLSNYNIWVGTAFLLFLLFLWVYTRHRTHSTKNIYKDKM